MTILYLSNYIILYYITDEDVLYGDITPSEEEQEEDSDSGKPRIGRQRKQSDSDFVIEDDSDSDWDSKPKRSARKPSPVSAPIDY